MLVDDIFAQLSKTMVGLLSDPAPVYYCRQGEEIKLDGILRSETGIKTLPETGDTIRIDELWATIHEPDISPWEVNSNDRIRARETLYDIATFHRMKNGTVKILLVEASGADGQQSRNSKTGADFTLKAWREGGAANE